MSLSVRRRRIVLIVAIVLPLAFELWPFNFTLPWHVVANGARFSDAPAIVLDAPGIVFDDEGASILHRRLAGGRAITVAVVAQSAGVDQVGPARIVSFSADPYRRNLTLGQRRDGLIFRVRTPATGENGIIDGLAARGAVRPDHQQVFVVTYDGAVVRIYVDGRLAAQQILEAGPLADWDGDFALVFGNEATGNRPWLGRISDIAIYDTALDAAAVARLSPANLAELRKDRVYDLRERCFGDDAGETCRLSSRMLIREPWSILSPKARALSDYLHSVVVWGVMAAVVVATGAVHRPIAAVAGLAAYATGLEVSQVLLPHRTSSLIDLAVAFAGIGLGLAIGWLRKSRGWRG